MIWGATRTEKDGNYTIHHGTDSEEGPWIVVSVLTDKGTIASNRLFHSRDHRSPGDPRTVNAGKKAIQWEMERIGAQFVGAHTT